MWCVEASSDCNCFFFFSSRRRHTRLQGDWSSDVCSSDLFVIMPQMPSYRLLRIPLGTARRDAGADRKSTRLNSSHLVISYAVFCLKKKKKNKSKYKLLHLLLYTYIGITTLCMRCVLFRSR